MIALKTSLSVPEFVADAGASERKHNAWVKEILRNEARHHLIKRIPGHFTAGASQRYAYQPRSEGYIRWKNRLRGKTVNMADEFGVRRPQIMDAEANRPLIRTGRTRREILFTASITTGGTLNNISSTLTMKPPIPGASGRGMDIAARLRILAKPNARWRNKKLGDMEKSEQRIGFQRRTIEEIERVNEAEVNEINNSVGEQYAICISTCRTVKVK